MKYALLIVVALVADSLIAQTCTYLAYEPFDYLSAQPLDDQLGGAGWAEPWLVQNDDQIIPGYQTGDGAALFQYQNLQTIGRFATGGRVYLTAGRRLNTQDGGPFDAYIAENQAAIGTQTGATLWMSAMLRKEQNNGESIFAGLHSSQLPWCDNCTGEKIEFGYFGAASDVNGERRWTLRIGDQYYPSNKPVLAGATAFMVVAIQFNTTATTVDFFANPTALGNATPVPDVTQSSPFPFTIRSVVTYLGNNPGNGAIDEIRLASSYPCVAPDPAVAINLPPVAQILLSDNDGIAPFTIQFDGSGSFDPEGGQLSYNWHFGDGSPQAVGPQQTHIYLALGNLTVRLTVKDESGLEHTDFKQITIRNATGKYPCQSSFTLLKPADCSGTGAVLQINNPPATFNLQTAGGTLLNPVNGTQYHALIAGGYRYTASSALGCRDSFVLKIPIDSTTCPGWQADQCRMAIGTNMSGFADWVPERPMRNLMKHVRRDFIAFDDNCFCWSNGNYMGIQTDADGYPLQIPQVFNGVSNKVRYVISSEGANLPPGNTYVLLYDGVGELTVQGGAVETAKSPGRIQFDVVVAENLFFRIDASQAGNHVRNIRVLRLEDENADLENEPFYPGFLDKIAPFQTLRFMDWGGTNHNMAVEWSQRTPVTYFTYGTEYGVPYEVMIQLANQTKKDVWICVPHAADNAYLAQMAALFRDELDPSLNIYLEYSNEVWNWIFPQAHYNNNNAPSNLNYGRAMAMRAGNLFSIWHEVFGDSRSRVKRVLGLQAGYNYLNEQILSQLDPSEWDYGSPTSYLGLDHSDTGNPVLTGASSHFDIIENARNAWHSFIPALRQDYNNIKLFGKEIVNYEGGQHFVGNVFGIGYPYQQAMYDAQYSIAIYDLYSDMLDTIRNWGSRMFGNFSLASRQESIYGSWGVLNDIDIQAPYLITAPKYQALLDHICVATPTDTEDDLPLPYQSLTVFPNPTTGYFTLEIAPAAALETEVVVFDMLGRTVYRRPWKLVVGSNRLEVNLSGKPAGLYQVNVGGIGKKLVKLPD